MLLTEPEKIPAKAKQASLISLALIPTQIAHKEQRWLDGS